MSILDQARKAIQSHSSDITIGTADHRVAALVRAALLSGPVVEASSSEFGARAPDKEDPREAFLGHGSAISDAPDFDKYQRLAARTFPATLSYRDALAMSALGLAGEAGEAADLVKKHLFHGHELDLDRLKKEIGDVLWYASQLARVLDVALSEIARANIAKLNARYPDGFSEQASRDRAEGDR